MSGIIKANLKLEGKDHTIASTTLCAVPLFNQKIQIHGMGDKSGKYIVVDIVQVIEGPGPSTLDVFVKPLKDLEKALSS